VIETAIAQAERAATPKAEAAEWPEVRGGNEPGTPAPVIIGITLAGVGAAGVAGVAVVVWRRLRARSRAEPPTDAGGTVVATNP